MDEAARRRRLLDLVAADGQAMAILRAARALGLNDWAIGAGFVRNWVWDWLSGYRESTPFNDIDVLYHDPADLREETEKRLEACLRDAMPDGPPWSVKNQARMHIRNGDAAYGTTENALRFWLETPTCVAVRLEADEGLTLLAPHGLADLFDLVVRPTPNGRIRLAEYRRRIRGKNWPDLWPRLRIESLTD
jgi:uncharacterized protein